MDTTAVFGAIKDGGPPVIFVLILILTLILTGQLKPKTNVDSEAAAREAQHKAELEARDRQITELVRLNERQSERMDRQQELFGESLGLIRQELIPMLRSSAGRVA